MKDDINEKARKENVEKLLSNLRCIDVATNILNLNMERARSNPKYLKAKEHSSMVFDLKVRNRGILEIREEQSTSQCG